jgi:3-hydroxybutyryl-CoA dehydrogenase
MVKEEKKIKIGVVGLGLMGTSIITALLIAGHKVIAVAPIEDDLLYSPERLVHYLNESYKNGLIKQDVNAMLANVTFTKNYEDLQPCSLIMECVVENMEIKKLVYQKIECHIEKDAILTTNTSALPIDFLKDHVKYPNRFIGLHWAEPAFTSKFLEIVCSSTTDIAIAENLYRIATIWGKEPTLVRKDIRGFITNRIMYAMYREAFFLVENGYATIEDVDRSCRNDGGHWMPFCGLFRYMDITGLQAYYHVMKDLFPTLNNQTEVPELIKGIAEDGGAGISNGKGFYNYTKQEAQEWERAYEEFAFDISRLSNKYPIDLVEKRLNGEEKKSPSPQTVNEKSSD